MSEWQTWFLIGMATMIHSKQYLNEDTVLDKVAGIALGVCGIWFLLKSFAMSFA